MSGAITLKSVSRSRSDVGLTFNDGGLFRFRPLYSPAIIRMTLPDRRELEARILFDARDHLRSNNRSRPREIELRLLLRFFQQRLVAHDVSNAKLRQP